MVTAKVVSRSAWQLQLLRYCNQRNIWARLHSTLETLPTPIDHISGIEYMTCIKWPVTNFLNFPCKFASLSFNRASEFPPTAIAG